MNNPHAWTRRNFITSSAALSLLTAHGIRAQETPLPRLKDLALARGLHFGSDSDVQFRNAGSEYSTLFTQQCELFAPLMSWSYMSPTSPEPPEHQDPNLAFVREHKLKLTGGHLLWYKRTPDWLTDLSTADAEKAILARVERMNTLYGDILFSWNVVNEAIKDNADEMRPSVLNDKFGLDYFNFTAHKAKEVAPNIIRVYNDYGFELDTPPTALKRKRLLTLLDYFKKTNTPIDAIGLQSHMKLTSTSRFDDKVNASFLKEISGRGFKIMITELDVFDFDTPSDPATRDAMVAERYKRYLDVALDNEAVTTVVTWGLCDRYTWLTPKFNPKYARTDNTPSRPLLFDADLHPKPAFYAVADALRHAPKRKLI